MTQKMTLDSFIEKSKIVHGDRYDYSKSVYEHSTKNIEIICKEHGSFFQPPAKHLYGRGCPKCGYSNRNKKEQYVSESLFLKNDNIFICLNDLKIKRDKNYLSNITEEKRKSGLKIFHIFSDELRDKKDVVESMINYRIGKVQNKIFARKCEIKIVEQRKSQNFFDQNHISGHCKARISFGLYYNNELICCLSLKQPIQKKYGNMIEIARFATKLNTLVTGGFQRLLKIAIEYAKENHYEGIMTYADLRFGEGNVYRDSGFEYLGKTPVDYWYTNGEIREFRFKYRADPVNKLTENEVAERAGVYKVYGCGSNIYLLKF